MNEFVKKLEAEILIMFDKESTGHDLHHLQRVMNLALHLQEREGGDRLVIMASALLHDVHRIMEKKNGRYCTPKESLPKVQLILEDVGFPKDKVPAVLHCVEFHEEYVFSGSGKSANDIETLILQDADNLDAIGAIGVGRTFTFGGAYGVPMWRPELPFDRSSFDESVKDPSTIHHFKSKLLKLKGNMNTATAKAMAEKRHAFIERFLDEFIAEWKGER